MVFWKKKKVRVTSDEFAAVLARFCSESNEKLFEEVSTASETLNIQLDDVTLRQVQHEAVIINLWIVTFALTGYEKAEGAVQKLHQDYINVFTEHINDENERIELQHQLQSVLNQRYKKYFELWDNESGGMQSTLVVTMLQFLLSEGRPDRRFLDAQLMFRINEYILSRMLVITEAIGSYDISD